MSECNKCGDCCLFTSVKMKNNSFDKDFIDFLEKTRPNTFIFKDNNKTLRIVAPCVHFDRASNLCKIYDNRPEKCKDYNCEKGNKMNRCKHDNFR